MFIKQVFHASEGFKGLRQLPGAIHVHEREGLKRDVVFGRCKDELVVLLLAIEPDADAKLAAFADGVADIQ